MLGFWSITLSIRGEFEKAALAIVLAMICDMLDGRIARATHSSEPLRRRVRLALRPDRVRARARAAHVQLDACSRSGRAAGSIGGSVRAVRGAAPGALQRARERADARSTSRASPPTFAGGMVAATVWFVELARATRRRSRARSHDDHELLRAARAARWSARSRTRASRRSRSRGARATRRWSLIVLTLVVVLLNHEPMLFGARHRVPDLRAGAVVDGAQRARSRSSRTCSSRARTGVDRRCPLSAS